MSEMALLCLIMGFSVLGLIGSFYLARWVLAKDTGTESMQKISNAIKEGAEAFLRRQFRTIICLAIVVAIIIYLGYLNEILHFRQSLLPQRSN